MPANTPPDRVQIAISSCLLGQAVRYDGGHKAHPFIVDTLSRYLECVPICPEVAIGLGVPRPPIQLTRKEGQIRAVAREDADIDVTQPLVDYGRSVAPSLDCVSGYIFKSRSPSCGLWDVCIQADDGESHEGRGIFANEITRYWPQLPVLDEQSLNDPGLRDNFLERVYAYYR